eukprot:3831570-Amphidinium_carterae.1
MFGKPLANLRLRSDSVPGHTNEVEFIKSTWSDGKPIENATAFTDGAVVHPTHRGIRYAGWAVAWLREDGTLGRAVWGTLPDRECPRQTSTDAELFAVGVASQVTQCSPVIVTDSRATLDLIAQGSVKGLSTQQPRAHLLRQYWLSGGRTMQKVKAHLTEEQAAAQDVPKAHWLGNAMADRLAGEAARMHPRAEKAPELLAVEAKLKEIAKWAAIQVESSMGDPWRDNEGPPKETVSASPATAGEQTRRHKKSRWLAPTWLGGLVDAAKQSVEDFLTRPKGKRKERRVHQQEGVAEEAPLDEVPVGQPMPQHLRKRVHPSHGLIAYGILEQERRIGTLWMCRHCGRYSSGRLTSLTMPCHPEAPSKQQLRRVGKLLHPAGTKSTRRLRVQWEHEVPAEVMEGEIAVNELCVPSWAI